MGTCLSISRVYESPNINVNYEGVITYVSQTFLILTGYNESDLINKSIKMFMPLLLYNSHMSTFKYILKNYSDNTNIYEHSLVINLQGKTNVTKVILSVNLYTSYMLVTFNDYKESRKESRKEFDSNISIIPTLTHDIRNHLHISENGLSLIKEKVDDPYILTIIKSIQLSNSQINTLINTNIELYKMSTNIPYEWVDINSMIFQLTGHLKTIYDSISLTINISNNIKFNIHFFTVSFAIRSILSNLITNSCKYTTKGDINISFFFTNVTPNTGNFKFSITDTGGGLPLNVKKYLLDKGEYKDTLSEIKGTGIGIRIIKDMLKVINGKIIINNSTVNINIYSRFKISSPSHELSPTFTMKRKINNFSLEYIDNKIGILIVDDNKISTKILEKNIGNEYTVYIAHNGMEAIDKVEKYLNIKIILMDNNMPIMGGIEATQIIRTFKREYYIVCISADSYINDEYKELFNSILVKPIKKEDLTLLIDSIKVNYQ